MSQKSRLERERRRAAHEEEMVKLRGTRKGRTWAKTLGLFVPFFVITLAFAALAALYLLYAGRTTDRIDTTVAGAQLRLAVAAADSFAGEHGNSYAAMAVSDLKMLEPSLIWVMGTPNSGEVGIIETGAATFRLVYKDSRGSEFQAVRDEQGRVTYTTAAGTPF